MPLLKKLRTLAAKVETTPGTAVSLAAADGAFNAYDVMVQAEIEVEERPAQGSFDNLVGSVGQRRGTCSFKTDVGWDGLNLPDWASTLFPACGYTESTQVYRPKSEAPGTNVKTVTIGVYQDGRFKKLAGAVGNFKFVMPTGRMITVEWEFQGVWEGVTDAAIIAPTYPTAAALRFGSGTVTWNSVAQKVEQVTFDAGNEITLLEDASTAAGFSHGIITGRRPVFTLNPESQLVATDDKYGQWLAGDEYAFSCAIDGPAGSGSNGAITLASTKAQVFNVQEADRNGVEIDEVELRCNKNAANLDQDVSITFTDKT